MFDFIRNCFAECGGRVTTDSRAIKGGEMFIALTGENFDGNDYAEKAIQAGAQYAVIKRGSACAGYPGTLEVDDPFEVLRQLAIYNRKRFGIPVIGLTGTNGKTTTKELIRAVLAKKYNVVATEGNLNNDIGVPLSLLKIRHDTEVAVIEMGASHPGDIKKLVDVAQPDMGLVTNVGRAHLEGFGSFEGVKATKGELYDFLAAADAPVFLNEADEDLKAMAAERVGVSLVPYGVGYDDVELLPSTAEEPFLRFNIEGKTVSTKLVGSYNIANALAAICVGRYFEVPLDDAIAAIQEYTPSNSRSQRVQTERNTLIVDAYNANPSSMTAAIENFALIDAPMKLALLGEMRELGQSAGEEHRAIVELLRSRGIEAMLVGEEFEKAAAGAFKVFASSDELAAELDAARLEGRTILVKGSHSTHMEKVVKSL